MRRPTAGELVELLGLEPLPVEGGLFRQSWRSASTDGTGRVAGTAIYLLYTDDPDSFSAMHRLATDEVYHFYLGDPVGLLELLAGGSSRRTVLGPDLLGGQAVQHVVPGGTWMGSHRIGGPYGFSLLGTTMAPGFDAAEFEACGVEPLVDRWPDEAELIGRLVRPGAATRRMPPEL